MAKKTMKINGTSLSTYGIYISSDTYLDSPLIDYSEFQVPARSGNVILDNKRLNNVVRKFSCYVKDNPTTAIANLKKLIYGVRGYMKLESDYDPTTYQMGYLAQEIQFSPFQTGTALTVNFDLYFSCRPEKYKTSIPSILLNRTDLNNGTASLLPRSHPFIQDMFSKMPPNMIPDDFAFLCFEDGNDLSETNLSSVSMSWSGGNSFLAVCAFQFDPNNYNQYLFTDLLAYTNTSMSEPLLSTSSTLSPQYPLFIIPVKTSGNLLYSFTETFGGQSYSYTIPLVGSANTTSDTAAFGVELLFKGAYSSSVFVPGAFVTNGIYLASKFNSNYTGEEIFVVLRNDLMPNSLSSTLSDYATDGKYLITYDLTTNTATMSKTGKPDLSMNEYVEIYGGINRADAFDVINYGGTSLAASLDYRWWYL